MFIHLRCFIFVKLRSFILTTTPGGPFPLVGCFKEARGSKETLIKVRLSGLNVGVFVESRSLQDYITSQTLAPLLPRHTRLSTDADGERDGKELRRSEILPSVRDRRAQVGEINVDHHQLQSLWCDQVPGGGEDHTQTSTLPSSVTRYLREKTDTFLLLLSDAVVWRGKTRVWRFWWKRWMKIVIPYKMFLSSLTVRWRSWM